MGTRVIHECDRCGKEGENPDDFETDYHRFGSYVGDEPHLTVEFTYCKECLKVWIRGVRRWIEEFNKNLITPADAVGNHFREY